MTWGRSIVRNVGAGLVWFSLMEALGASFMEYLMGIVGLFLVLKMYDKE